MEKEGPQDVGRGRSNVRALFTTPAEKYIAHLRQQFKGTDVEGLAAQVEDLLANSAYKSRVERDVDQLRGRAIHTGFINDRNTLTKRARVHLSGWYPLAQGVPNYQGYAQRGLTDIVRGYKPRETK